MTPSKHNEQLRIDLENAHKENRELREENRRLTVESIKDGGDFKVGIGVGALLVLFTIFFVSCL